MYGQYSEVRSEHDNYMYYLDIRWWAYRRSNPWNLCMHYFYASIYIWQRCAFFTLCTSCALSISCHCTIFLGNPLLHCSSTWSTASISNPLPPLSSTSSGLTKVPSCTFLINLNHSHSFATIYILYRFVYSISLKILAKFYLLSWFFIDWFLFANLFPSLKFLCLYCPLFAHFLYSGENI